VPYVLPTKASAKINGPHPEKSTLTASGVIDTGPGAPDFSSPATFDAGPFHLVIPAFTSKNKGKTLVFVSGANSLTIKPAANGSSHALFTSKFVGDFGTALDPDGQVTLRFQNARYDASSTVKLKKGALKPGAVVAPDLAVVSAAATLVGKGKDALTFTAGFATSGVAPPVAEDLTICFGNAFTATISAASFRLTKNVATLTKKTAGITKATVDYAKGTITVAGKGLDLGAFATGGNGVVVTLTLGGVDHVAQILMARAKSKLAY